MYALVRIDVSPDEPTSAFDDLATLPGGPTDPVLDVCLTWFRPDDAHYVVVSGVDDPEGVGYRIADFAAGVPLQLDVLQLASDANIGDEGRVLFAPTPRSILMALPPGIATCPLCQADLTIEEHRSPPCSVRQQS